MTRRAVGSRLCALHQSIGFFSHSRLPKAIAAALSNPLSFSSHISVALEFDAISSFSSVPGLLTGEMVFSAVLRPVSRAVLVLFYIGLARCLVALLVTAETTPWVCCKRSIPPCVSGHAESSSPGSNCPSTTACIVGCTRGESSSTKNFCRPLFVVGRPCRTWMDRLNRLPLLMSSLVLRQESFRHSSRHLLTIFLRARATPPPPPPKKHRRGLSPVHPSLSPTMFEVVTGEFRWNLQSKHRVPRGWSGGIWAEDLLR